MGVLAGFLLGRAVQAAVVSAMVATLCFLALHALPGDLALNVAAARYGDDRVTESNVELVRRQAGLDRPVLVQYASWIGRLAAGDPGRSLLTGRPVVAELTPMLAVTLGVGGLAATLAMLLALPMGAAAGLHPGGRFDRAVMIVAAMTASTPSFVAGTLLVAFISIHLRWLPSSGTGSLVYMILPATTLALALLPGLARVIRHAVAGVALAPYTVFARMRGVPVWRVALRVAARPALIPIVAYLPVVTMNLIEGFVTVELVFNLEGIGTLLVRSLLGRDLPVVMGAGIAFVLLMAAINTLTDLSLRLLDPRPRSIAV
jgi:peptide/nickel transport system permease protein